MEGDISKTEKEFRRIALELSDVTESAEMGHPDFRVGGKIFATLRLLPPKGVSAYSTG